MGIESTAGSIRGLLEILEVGASSHPSSGGARVRIAEKSVGKPLAQRMRKPKARADAMVD